MSRVSRLLWTLGSPLRWALIGLIAAYRFAVSPMLGPTCRYYPSCSAYGLECLKTHGVVKGLMLTAWRILRCHPWSKGGVDPVPLRGCWHPEPDESARLSAA